MSKQKTPKMVTDNLKENPAVLAWSQLRAGLPKPKAIELIRNIYSKTPVVRLVGVGKNGTSVIAKKTELSKGMIERTIYKNLRSYLPKKTLHYYGHVEAAGQTCWIFVEDAGGSSFSFSNFQHTAIAIEWLAELHTSVPLLDCLQDRGLQYYYARLVSGHKAINLILSNNKALHDRDIELLNSIISQFDYLLQRWDIVCALYEQMPKGLIHGDFKTKNLRVRSDNKRSTLVVFDWECAGWGLPGIDIWRLDLEAYWLKVRDHWSQITLEDVVQLSNLGKLLWCFNAIYWEVTSITYDYIEKSIEFMKAYKERMDRSIQDIYEIF